LSGYLAQQYGFGYGRLDVVACHPTRYAGDAVSPPGMMGHPLVTGAAICLIAADRMAAATVGRTFGLVSIGVMLLVALAAERLLAGVRAWRQFGDAAALAFPLVHLARNIAWVAAIGVWTARRLLGRPVRPEHSMTARAADTLRREMN
jgi:hypothetical protein